MVQMCRGLCERLKSAPISEQKESISVEIKDGVVVPEFGLIASLVLAVSIFAIIIFSTKSRLSILPRY
ncbi:MAG: PEFG-CTERM sorting domain-containing protein [Nitrosopumilus sp.]|nr:PEFG-CTERM sorting domain-containing protein [Nitrosopumilus sp.]